METLLKVVFWVAMPLAVAAWWQSDDFVPHPTLPIQAIEDPAQKSVRKKGFEVTYNDVAYDVLPKYDYDLYGMVVSYRYHDGDRMLHKVWNDHLNVADVCVVWGHNLTQVNLNALDFWNGQFTCNVSTRDSDAWRRFSMTHLSNNHLITEDDRLRDRISALRVGDVIRVRGWLSWYGQAGRGDDYMRRTSVTREDTGDGACETIYVRDFDVIGSMPNQWRTVFSVAGIAALVSALVWMWGVGSGRFAHRKA